MNEIYPTKEEVKQRLKSIERIKQDYQKQSDWFLKQLQLLEREEEILLKLNDFMGVNDG